jgi:hypothetical protein
MHALVSAIVLLGVSAALVPPADPPTPALDHIAVQARGPVHEAFAQPSEPSPQPRDVVPRQPPDPIPEEPPAQRPSGKDVQWIPGYWGWDADRNNYVWVSGFWRVPPPGRRWVSGHWFKSDEGWQWVSGFWQRANADVPEYHDAPPASLDDGPPVPQPSEDSIYVPGGWVPGDDRYGWRPGYWSRPEPGWVWNPPSYRWTPAGCLYIDGYWDYPLEDRGLLFAPVWLDAPLWSVPSWRFRPSYAVLAGTFLDWLWLPPNQGHYYFGDYYGPRYAGRGFRPWHQNRTDPLVSYYRWRNHNDRTWWPGLESTFAARQSGQLPLPPRTLAEQIRKPAAPAVIAPLDQLASTRSGFGVVPTGTRAQIRTSVDALRQTSLDRSRAETEAALARRPLTTTTSRWPVQYRALNTSTARGWDGMPRALPGVGYSGRSPQWTAGYYTPSGYRNFAAPAMPRSASMSIAPSASMRPSFSTSAPSRH